MNRRRFVQTALATHMLSTTPLFAERGTDHTHLLIGTHDGEGIYRATWDVAGGGIGSAELAVQTPRPTYITRHPRLPVVYACNETDEADGGISAFSLEMSGTPTLKPLGGTQHSGGAAPCFVSVHPSGRLLFAANYGGGSLSAFALDAQGVPGPAATTFRCAGNPACGTHGPVADRQDGPHMHCATLSPDGQYVVACDLGDDSVLAFRIRGAGSGEPLDAPVRIAALPGAGPRHLAFHPKGLWLYCINELDCTVTWVPWSAGAKVPSAFESSRRASILPPGAPAAPASTGAELQFTRDGRFLYTSTRFSNVLTVFGVAPSGGALTQVQQLPCGGKTPRFFALDPTETWLLCANQDSNDIAVFRRDRSTGKLSPGKTFQAPNPECLLWI